MKILQLCNKIPYPPYDGGAVAMLNMAKSFANKGLEVIILAMSTDKHKKSNARIPDELSKKIRFVYIDVDTKISLPKLFINLLFSKQPYNAVRFISQKYTNALAALLQQETFDIIQLEGLYLKSYISFIRKYHKGLLVYRAHNVESEIWCRMVKITRNPVKRAYMNVLAKRISRFEKDIINQYDLLIPISAIDLSWFQSNGNIKPAHITPTGIPDENFNSTLKKETSPDLFHIGALDWIPNQEALLWFTEQVWPALRKKYPDIRFHVAGRNAPEWLAKKLKNALVDFHGEVDDALCFIDDHWLMVVPLFAGSGLRIKIIEAMARSKPIITTTIGAQGMNVTSGRELIIADTQGDFIQSIDTLLNDMGQAEKLQKNALAFARQNFSDEQIVKNLLYFYRQHKV